MTDPDKKKSIWTMDLLELPALRRVARWLGWLWPGGWPPLFHIRETLAIFLFGTFRAHRGAKAMLFAELGESARQNVPLDVALDLCQRSFVYGPIWNAFPFSWLLAPITCPLQRVEYIASNLARRLHRRVSRGIPLSNAMMTCGGGFSPQEVRIVRAGEEWSLLPQALKRLARYQQIDYRLNSFYAHMAYPAAVGMVALPIVSFILVFILPKFQDMYAQLGAQRLPPITEKLLFISYEIVHGGFWLFMILLVLLISSIASRWNPQIGIRPLLSFLLRRLPIIGGAYRAEEEAHWLAALSLALEAGAAPPDAVRTAGEICGGGLQRRSEAAARAIVQGHGIGEACLASHVLTPAMNNLLVLLNWRGDYVESLKAISVDADLDAQAAVARASKVAEMAGIVCIGMVAAFVIIALYMPLFEMPIAMLNRDINSYEP